MKPTPMTHAVQPARVIPASSPPAEREADAHRRRLAEAERDHEGQRRELQRDGMRGDRGGADPAHEISGEREHAHFQRHGDADRPAEPDHRQRPLAVEPPPVAEQVEAAELAVDRR